MPVGLVYDVDLNNFNYGPGHPMLAKRLQASLEAMNRAGLLTHPDLIPIRPSRAEEDYLLAFHSPDYLAAIRLAEKTGPTDQSRKYGLGYRDNPLFSGVWNWCRLMAGAARTGMEAIESGRVEIAFSMAGGLHHARPNKAAGFCYINDPVLVLKDLAERGKRAVYVDLDAHHGDGVQNAFYDSDRIMTISLHQDPATLWPRTGRVDEIGQGRGVGYSVNIPLPIGTCDQEYLWVFNQVVPPLIRSFAPDVLVTQMGTDALAEDPLTKLILTRGGYADLCLALRRLGLPWLAFGGGGYHLETTAACWTIALEIMLTGAWSGDQTSASEIDDAIMARLEETAAALKKLVFPRHGLK